MQVVDNGELLGEGPGDAEDAEDAQRDGDDSDKVWHLTYSADWPSCTNYPAFAP